MQHPTSSCGIGAPWLRTKAYSPEYLFTVVELLTEPRKRSRGNTGWIFKQFRSSYGGHCRAASESVDSAGALVSWQTARWAGTGAWGEGLLMESHCSLIKSFARRWVGRWDDGENAGSEWLESRCSCDQPFHSPPCADLCSTVLFVFKQEAPEHTLLCSIRPK